jgi:peptide/nickel transport system substrate-binding protein
MFEPRPRRRLAVIAAVTVALGSLLAGCSSAGDSASKSRDAINYALPPNFTPNWILPIGTSGKLNTNNSSIAESLWEKLVAYDGATGTVAWQKDASIAGDVAFDPSGTSATITLGHRTWSDGQPVTARDVQFFYNLVKANKEDWANYNAGQAPDNWTSLTVVDDTHLVITFDKPYNTDWMLANELSMITPLRNMSGTRPVTTVQLATTTPLPQARSRCGSTSTRRRATSPATPPTRCGRSSTVPTRCPISPPQAG